MRIANPDVHLRKPPPRSVVVVALLLHAVRHDLAATLREVVLVGPLEGDPAQLAGIAAALVVVRRHTARRCDRSTWSRWIVCCKATDSRCNAESIIHSPH